MRKPITEETFRLLVRSVRDYAIFLLDPTGHIASWNEGAQRIKGYTEDEIVGKHFSVFYPEEAVKSEWPQYELRMACQDGRFEDESWRIRKDGSRFWANVVITALFDEQRELKGFAKVTRDLTERRKSEEQIRALNAELQVRVDELAQTNRTLAAQTAENEAFVYSVSHDIRGPLVNLQGFSQEMKLAGDELRAFLTSEDVPEEVRKHAKTILDSGIDTSVAYVQNAVLHLGRIVDGLLRLSRAGRVAYQWNIVPLVPIVKRVVESLRLTMEGARAQVEIDELPPAWGDASALEQLYANLIANAVHYLDSSRPGLIHVGALPVGISEQTYFVSDNGLGIPDTSVAKVFRVFQRFHPDVHEGEGMGLAIVNRIVQRHNGRIWVESSEGKGTTFYVALPLPDHQP